jgi:hypothetical protein
MAFHAGQAIANPGNQVNNNQNPQRVMEQDG